MEQVKEVDLFFEVRKSVFENFISQIERNKLKDNNKNLIYYDLVENALLILERGLQDIEELEDKIEGHKQISQLITLVLGEIGLTYSLLNMKPDEQEAFAYSILGLYYFANDFKDNGFEFIKASNILYKFFPYNKLITEFKKSIKNNHQFKMEINSFDPINNTAKIVLGSSNDIVIIDDDKIRILENKKSNTTYHVNRSEIKNMLSLINFKWISKNINNALFELTSSTLNYFFNLKEYTDTIQTNYLGNLECIKKNHLESSFGDLKINILLNNSIDTYLKERANFSYNQTAKDDFENFTYEWDISIKFLDKKINTTNLFNFLYVLTSVLDQIDDVEVVLESWEKGSWIVKMKLKMKSWLGKEEVKEVLDKARKAAESYTLDRPIEDVEKTKAERIKLEKESKMIPDDDIIKETHALDLKGKKLDIEVKEQELIHIKLENKLKAIETVRAASQLLADGIVNIDSDLQISINDVLFIEKKGKNIIISEKIEKIDENGKKLPSSELDFTPIE